MKLIDPLLGPDPAAPNTPATGEGAPAAAPKVEARVPAPDPSKIETAGGGMMAAGEVQRLQAIAEASSLLLRTDTAPQKREQAIRFLMEQNGYTAEQIEGYMQQAAPQAPAGQEQQPNELVQAVQETQEATRQLRVSHMRQSMDQALEREFDSKAEVGVLLGQLKSYQGEKHDREKLLPILREKIRREALDRLKLRRAKVGSFQEGWIPEEVSAAAKAVAEEYRTVIGDVSLIGASPETVSGEDEFLKSTPVKAPEFKAGMNHGEAQALAHSFTADALSRLTYAGGEGGTRA